MTQSLIVFTVLQLASLAIIFAFAALERLRSGTGPSRGRLQGEQSARTPGGPARKRGHAPQSRSRVGLAAKKLLRAKLPGWPKPSTASSALRREHNDARADPMATSRPRHATGILVGNS